MSSTVLYMSVSLDGFIAGPNESPDNGLGDGDERLHEWSLPDSGGDSAVPTDEFRGRTAVTDGVEAAMELASAVPGDADIAIAGGASTVNQYLAAGLLDELRLHITPFTLGAGTRIFDGVPP
jgi:dihydrofolate reductase